jgi:hypothetical protein
VKSESRPRWNNVPIGCILTFVGTCEEQFDFFPGLSFVKHIRHHPRTNTVSVGEGDPGGKRVVPVVNPFRVDLRRNPIAPAVYENVLYPAVEAEDRRAGRKDVAYSLVQPDPWLIALAMVMWEGIVQGLSWDVVKVSVRKALAMMQAEGVAPSETYKKKSSDRTELGFCWTAYKNGKKQYDMFVGLRRVHKERLRKSRNKS